MNFFPAYSLQKGFGKNPLKHHGEQEVVGVGCCSEIVMAFKNAKILRLTHAPSEVCRICVRPHHQCVFFVASPMKKVESLKFPPRPCTPSPLRLMQLPHLWVKRHMTQTSLPPNPPKPIHLPTCKQPPEKSWKEFRGEGFENLTLRLRHGKFFKDICDLQGKLCAI